MLGGSRREARAISTLQQLIETIGKPLLETVLAPRVAGEEIGDVLVYDPTDPPAIGRGDIVLGIGLDSLEDFTAVARDLRDAAAAGIVMKVDLLTDEHITIAAEMGIALLAIPTGASWSHLVALLQTASRSGGYRTDGGPEDHPDPGDIFALADAIYALVGEPITIEDRLSRVIGYSSGQEQADPARADTIVGRKVPDRFVQLLEQRGVFEELHTSEGATYLESIGPGILPRLAVAVKAGNEVLGYLWAACRTNPSPQQIAAFEGASKTAALHLLQHRAGADMERRIEADLVSAALAGGGAARDVLARLDLQGSALCVIAISVDTGEGDLPDLPARVHAEVRDMISAEFRANRIPGKAAILGGVIYLLAGVGEDGSLSNLKRAAQHTVGSARTNLNVPLLVGIGNAATTVWDIPRSHQEADAALRVLRAGRWKSPVAMIDDVRMHALLLRFGEIALEEQTVYTKKIQPLIESDATKGTDYLETLRTYLDTHGDISETSRRLIVHSNTVRYRLSRLQELAGIDLADQNDRLALTILCTCFQTGPEEYLSSLPQGESV